MEKLRHQHSVASAVLFFLKTNRFREDVVQYNPFKVVPLASPPMIQAAQKGLQVIYKKWRIYIKTWVILLDLRTKNTDSQFDLFEYMNNIEQKQKSDRLMQALDGINHKMGKILCN